MAAEADMVRVWVAALAAMLVGGSAAAVADDAEDCSNAEVLLKADPARAVSACQELAEHGAALGQNNLASIYFRGQGVSWNYKEAAKLYREAAEQGYAAAQCNLALMYHRGNGVPQDD